MSVCGRSLICSLVVFLGSVFVSTYAVAGDSPPSQTDVAQSEKATTSAKAIPAANKFERAERVEEMRYRHLWLAYAFIWLIVFVFVFRTWKLGQETASELEALNRRLKSLEATPETSAEDENGDA